VSLNAMELGAALGREGLATWVVEATVDADCPFFAMLARHLPDVRARLVALIAQRDSDVGNGTVFFHQEHPVALLDYATPDLVHARQLVSLRHYLSGVQDRAAFQVDLMHFKRAKAPVPAAGVLYLTRIVVDERARGSGIAVDVMRHLFAQQRLAGLAQLYLHVHRENAVARRFYAKLGFNDVQTAESMEYFAMRRELA
jgi:ribosomal protein S18 acetylase RimI-like enzyme